jgi:hypothetical protein
MTPVTGGNKLMLADYYCLGFFEMLFAQDTN